MSNKKEKIGIPLFLRSIEEKRINEDKEKQGYKDKQEDKFCFSQKYQGYCRFQKSNRWKSLAIHVYNDKD